MVKIRKETADDYDAVRDVNHAAFGQNTEGSIVDRIRDACDEVLSLVAEKEDEIVGHVLFSPVLIRNENSNYTGMGLGPMAVIPACQNQGIGSKLVKEGLRILKVQQVPFVVVLGHPDYYPRFGFEKASKYNLVPQWEGIPDEAFMVQFLDETLKGKVQGQVYYRSEFSEAV